jgi:sugar O-acyltransferase (sialic acid O-acetyltransferase NeuD family)
MNAREIRAVLLGGGGHAKMLIEIIRLQGGVRLAGILDADRGKWGSRVMGVPVLGGDDLLPSLVSEGTTHFAVGLGSIKDTTPRHRLFELGIAGGMRPLTLVHPSSIVSPDAVVGEGSQLLPGSIVNLGARIGRNVIVNSAAVVEHDCVIEDHVHIATGARLASTIHVGEGAHIGAGATLRQCVRIGSGAVVGAGAVVITDVLPGLVVVGVPARPHAPGKKE